jgi:Holliday junction resolvase
MSELRERLDRATTERQMYAELTRAAHIGGFLLYHTHDSRHSAAGFPDILALRGGELLAYECKTERGAVRPAQREWLAALNEFVACHGLEDFCEARVVRPSDLPACLERLASRPGLPAEVVA